MKKQIVDGKLECSRCHEVKPVDMFYAAKKTSTGRMSHCKACDTLLQKKRPKIRREGVVYTGKGGQPAKLVVDGKYRCGHCGELKPIEEFTKNSRTKSGLSNRCKACDAVYNAEAYAGLEYQAKRIANAAEWNREHPEQKRENGARWRAENPEKVRDQNAKWHTDHPRERRQYILDTYDLTFELFEELLFVQDERCGACGVSMRYADSQEYDAVIDHLGPKGPECAVQGLLHHTCNGALSKKRRTLNSQEAAYRANPPCLQIPVLSGRHRSFKAAENITKGDRRTISMRVNLLPRS